MKRFLINDCNLRQLNDSIAMISVVARPPLVLVKISVRPVIHRCLLWHSKKRHRKRWGKGIQLLAWNVAPGR